MDAIILQQGPGSGNAAVCQIGEEDALVAARVEAFSDILERDLPEVGLHGKNGFAVHFGECGSIEGARELEVGKRSSGVLVLIHVVVVVVCRTSRNVEHCCSFEGGFERGVNLGVGRGWQENTREEIAS